MLRAIHIFPELENDKIISDIRRQYDPLHQLIAPHVTVVFPFESDLTTEALIEHMQSVIHTSPFEMVLSKVEAVEQYLFLMVQKGNDEIRSLYDALHTGILSDLETRKDYLPHVTIGRLASFEAAKEVCKTLPLPPRYELTVKALAIEIIGEDDSSTIEYIHALKEVQNA